LGTGNIAGKFAKDLATIRDRATLTAVGSRDRAKAEAFARSHGAAHAHGSYDDVLRDPDVDAVYISLLNHQHAEWTIAAARSGKHILCEKPATMTAAELALALEAVRRAGVFYMEAFAYRCHPRYAKLKELLAVGVIGEVRMLHAVFCFDGTNLGRPRLTTREHGGGALMDVGVYPLSWLRWIVGKEPVSASAEGHLGPTGIDDWAAGVLRFTDGAIGTFATSIGCVQPSCATIHGSQGAIEVVEPWRCPPEAPLIVRATGKAEERIICDDGLGNYAREALTVAVHIASRQSPDCTWADSLAGMTLLDDLRHQVGVWWPGEAGAPATSSD
ncbi:MAG: Gfo/Idh/MocA family oxidoreductase, partial [Planctomycetes bacterium]|nr:Gfo/Idh/MocA family oxidoreductase [Planctomycetota bacterium]